MSDLSQETASADAVQGTTALDPAHVSKRRGPVEELCREIGFDFDRRIERFDVFVAFVRELVGEIEDKRRVAEFVGKHGGKEPSEGSAEALRLAEAMLAYPTPRAAMSGAHLVHEACHRLNPDDAYPTDHLIDMVSSCASAIRFGLEPYAGRAWSSRHAAEAASHVWGQVYGVVQFDGNTPRWKHEWARGKLLSAIISLLPADGAGRVAANQSQRQRSEPEPTMTNLTEEGLAARELSLGVRAVSFAVADHTPQPSAFTPGPWAWVGNQHGIYLATTHSGRRYVMGFRRMGTQNAQPVFQVNQRMVPAAELVEFEVGDGKAIGFSQGKEDPSVYRYDIVGIDAPDARLIAAAPDLLEALKALLEDSYPVGCDENMEVREQAIAAIAKATGAA